MKCHNKQQTIKNKKHTTKYIKTQQQTITNPKTNPTPQSHTTNLKKNFSVLILITFCYFKMFVAFFRIFSYIFFQYIPIYSNLSLIVFCRFLSLSFHQDQTNKDNIFLLLIFRCFLSLSYCCFFVFDFVNIFIFRCCCCLCV